MSVWHGDLHKKKASGGRKRSHRKKRKFEIGSFPTETTRGIKKTRLARTCGGNVKARLLNVALANVSDPATGKAKRVEITRVSRNPANVDYDRRGVITKGTIIETPLGTARVTSRPGQAGVANAILIPKKK
ncbi:MAG: 30S ribosomal protein S8e [Candidatus Bathyarchaeota archaeon]|nr:MAG: 30S ribosomal protein S8e [Candidatus Bathyarchaeota archaeon]